VEVVKEDTSPFSKPPEKGLPPKPINGNRASSIYSNSTNSEASRNNANLPDGWTIQMTEDGRSWYYYNEYTGKITHQNPLLSEQDTDNIIDKREQKIIDHRDSFFHPSQPIEEEEEIIQDQTNSQNAPTTAEVLCL
jgi:hypothetical protein